MEAYRSIWSPHTANSSAKNIHYLAWPGLPCSYFQRVKPPKARFPPQKISLWKFSAGNFSENLVYLGQAGQMTPREYLTISDGDASDSGARPRDATRSRRAAGVRARRCASRLRPPTTSLGASGQEALIGFSFGSNQLVDADLGACTFAAALQSDDCGRCTVTPCDVMSSYVGVPTHNCTMQRSQNKQNR